MRTTDIPGIDSDTFHADMHSTKSYWQCMKVGGIEGKMYMPVIDSASEKGESLVFVPILAHKSIRHIGRLPTYPAALATLLFQKESAFYVHVSCGSQFAHKRGPDHYGYTSEVARGTNTQADVP